MDDITANFSLPQYRNGLIEALLLFSQTDEFLNEAHRIQNIWDLMLGMINEVEIVYYEEDVNRCIQILRWMVKTAPFGIRSHGSIFIGFSNEFEDQQILDQCVKSFSHCFAQPLFDEGMIDGFKRLSLKDHSAKVQIQEAGHMMHKFRIGLMINELMPGLGQDEKATCLAKSMHMTLALVYVKLMSYNTFCEQLKYAMGVTEDLDIPGINGFPPIMPEVIHGTVPLTRKHDLHCKYKLRQKLEHFVRRPEIMAMAIYTILALNCNNVQAKRVYENCKRLMVKAITNYTEFTEQDPEQAISSFFKDVEKYTELRTKIVFECCGKSHLPVHYQQY